MKKYIWLLAGLSGMMLLRAEERQPADRVRTVDGLIVVEGHAVPAAWQNPPLPEAEERAYWERANHVIRHFQGRIGVRTEGEQEKESFPITMYSFLTGQHQAVIDALQTPDRQAGTDHAWTLGIDLYWAFTLKGQMRKFFFFGPALDPEYRQRMFEAGLIWSAEDPRPSFELVHSLRSRHAAVREKALSLLNQFRENIAGLPEDAIRGTLRDRYAGQDLGEDVDLWMQWWAQYSVQGWQVFEDIERLANPFPHPRHGVGTGPVGGRWDPGVRGMRVDARNTDNLRAMRDIAVYLMAEATGNETVRLLYKDKIMRFVVNLYHVHHGEWDSENYLHHTIAPYHNLYDFAEDEEVVALAKAALDYLYTAAALKYHRGRAVAPTKRVGGGLGDFVWLQFGNTPGPIARPYYDLIHPITSSYRIPLATLRIGQGRFARPVEMINTKPTYSLWLPGQAEHPETWETLFYGRSFYLGSAVSRVTQGDVRAFEMMLDTADGGAARVLANSRRNFNGMVAGDQIGQFRNALVWLRRDGSANFSFQLPGAATAEIRDGIWFLDHGLTYLAIRPLNLDLQALAPLVAATRGDVQVHAAQTGGTYAGFAMLVADAEDHASFAAFRRQVLAEETFDVSGLAQGRVNVRTPEGNTLGMQWQAGDRRPAVFRNGERYDWDAHLNVYQPMGAEGPVHVEWQGGTLTLRAGEAFFQQTVTEDGRVTFTTTPPGP